MLQLNIIQFSKWIIYLSKQNLFGLFPAPIQVLKHLRYSTCVIVNASDIAHACATAAHYISSFLL